MKEVIGNCELYLGDFRHHQEWPGSYVVVTDPPYGISKTKGGSINTPKGKGNYAEYDDSRENLIGLIKPLMNLVHAGERAAITPGRTNMWLYDNAVDVGCYYQPAATSMSYWGRSTWQPILFYGRDPYIGKKIYQLHYQLTEKPSCAEHPCAKPQKGWDWLVARTARLTDLVIDPLMGSGTTGISCVKGGRKFIGVEINPRYFDLACKRIEQATRQADMFLEATT